MKSCCTFRWFTLVILMLQFRWRQKMAFIGTSKKRLIKRAFITASVIELELTLLYFVSSGWDDSWSAFISMFKVCFKLMAVLFLSYFFLFHLLQVLQFAKQIIKWRVWKRLSFLSKKFEQTFHVKKKSCRQLGLEKNSSTGDFCTPSRDF